MARKVLREEPTMTLDESLDTKQLRAELADALHDQWAFYLTEGILLLVLGLLAILVPQVATLSVTIVIGAAFFAGGVAGLVSTFTGRRAPGFWWSLASAVLAIVVGFLLLVQRKRCEATTSRNERSWARLFG